MEVVRPARSHAPGERGKEPADVRRGAAENGHTDCPEADRAGLEERRMRDCLAHRRRQLSCFTLVIVALQDPAGGLPECAKQCPPVVLE